MPNRSPSINLIKSTQGGMFAQFITWALTIGRLLVIVIELIALGAFLYRFSLDRQLIQLRSDIKQKQTIIVSQKENEAKYRDLQDRLKLASNFSSLSMERAKILKDILDSTPNDIKLKNLSYAVDSINITANVQGISSLSVFVNYLKKHPNIEAISLDSIEKKPLSELIVANISGALKKSKYDNTK
jgi:hypothetical protein